MTQPGKPSIQKMFSPIFTMKLATMGAEIGCVTLLIIFLAVFGGLWLDRLLGTKPILTILFVVGAGPLALFTTYWLAIRTVKDIQPGEKVVSPVQPGEEEEISE